MDAWLTNEYVQVAPQETEITSYLSGAVEPVRVENANKWEKFKL